jgi:hypothetical protein
MTAHHLLVAVLLSLPCIPSRAASQQSAPADFGFIQGKGYPKQYLPLVDAALQAAATQAHVDKTRVLDRWDLEKRESSVFVVLLEMIAEQPTSEPVSAAPAAPATCKVRLIGNGGELVRCADGKIWEVMLQDRTHALFWKPGQELRTGKAETPQGDYRFLLDNQATGDRVFARPLE